MFMLNTTARRAKGPPRWTEPRRVAIHHHLERIGQLDRDGGARALRRRIHQPGCGTPIRRRRMSRPRSEVRSRHGPYRAGGDKKWKTSHAALKRSVSWSTPRPVQITRTAEPAVDRHQTGIAMRELARSFGCWAAQALRAHPFRIGLAAKGSGALFERARGWCHAGHSSSDIGRRAVSSPDARGSTLAGNSRLLLPHRGPPRHDHLALNDVRRQPAAGMVFALFDDRAEIGRNLSALE